MDTNHDLTEWLISEGRQLSGIETVLQALIERLRANRLPIARVLLSHSTLHPELSAITYIWTEDRGTVAESLVPHGVQGTPIYLNSPIRRIYEGEDMVRGRLDGDAPFAYPIFNELKAEGFTDYVAYRLALSRGQAAPIALATKQPGGLTDTE